MIELKQCKRCNLTYLDIDEEYRKKGYCSKDCMKGGLTPMQKDEKKQGLYFDALTKNFNWM